MTTTEFHRHSWVTEGTAYRTGVRKNPVRHLLVHGDTGDKWVLWCSNGKGREDYNPHSRKFCAVCKELAKEAIEGEMLDKADVNGWFS